MKKTVLALICFFISIVSYSQDTTVYVKGYYVEKYREDEALFRIKNRRLKEAGKTYVSLIDGSGHREYYFTLSANRKKFMKVDDIKMKVYNNYHYVNTEIYRFPQSWNNSPAKEYLESKRIDFEEFPLRDTVPVIYSSPDNENVLFKFYKIEGWALRVKVDNDYLKNRDRSASVVFWRVNPEGDINRNIPSYYVYIFYKFDVIDRESPPEGFIKWEPTDEEIDNAINPFI